MRLAFEDNGWEDYLYWQTTDKAMLRRINKLIAEVLRDPFEGTGKPEPLKHLLRGAWSRRIDREHRLVYVVEKDVVVVVAARFHYAR